MYYLLNLIKFKNHWKILEKWEKILEKSGNFVSPEKWEPCLYKYLLQSISFGRIEIIRGISQNLLMLPCDPKFGRALEFL